MNTVLKKAAAFAAGAAALALLLELFLRLLGSRYIAELPVAGPRASYTVLCAGDSFTYGAGAPPQGSYPVQLEEILRARFPGRTIRVVNFGEVAQNTAQMLQRLPKALDEVRPDAVVLLSGMANYWNYWGYRDGTAPPRKKFYDRIRTVRLARLLWRSAFPPAESTGPAQARQMSQRNTPQQVLCRKMLDAKNQEGILSACKEAVKAVPDDVDALLNIGFTYLNTGRPEQALEWLAKVVPLDPANPMVYIGISNALGQNRGEAEKWMKIGAIRAGGGTPALFSGTFDISSWVRLDMRKAADLVRERGIKVLLQNYPLENPSMPQFREVSAALAALAAERGLPFVEQTAEFSRLVEQGRRDEYFARGDAHCSARGYRLMAERVADAMEKYGFIERGVKR
ncbi:MAG TPA: GDSL-type esterase/lipase family protein [Elusimicrobiales bacterium]|nr:GDSL-type esterase/lipase family protein [Elusimicrobiales bacterium]